MNRQKLDEIIARVDALLSEQGYTCIEVKWEAHLSNLIVFIDKLDPTLGQGILLDDCVKATKILEEQPLMGSREPGTYGLEVSSPGVERPLRKKGDFTRFCGETVKVQLNQVVDNRRQGIGELLGLDEEGRIAMRMDGSLWNFPWENLDRAELVYDWNSKK